MREGPSSVHFPDIKSIEIIMTTQLIWNNYSKRLTKWTINWMYCVFTLARTGTKQFLTDWWTRGWGLWSSDTIKSDWSSVANLGFKSFQSYSNKNYSFTSPQFRCKVKIKLFARKWSIIRFKPSIFKQTMNFLVGNLWEVCAVFETVWPSWDACFCVTNWND